MLTFLDSKFRTLDVSQRPCNGSEDYSYSKCIAKCFSNHTYHKVPCILPYIDPAESRYITTLFRYLFVIRNTFGVLFIHFSG